MEHVAKIISQLSAAGVEVYFAEDKLKARSLKGGLSPELLSLIKENKPKIIQYLGLQAEIQLTDSRPKIVSFDRKTKYLPTSFAQQRLWFITQMDPGSTLYNMPSSMRLKGDFNVEVAQQALEHIIERHESLRTVFIDGQGGPFQVIQEHCKFKINQSDISHLDVKAQDEKIQSAIKQDAQKPFDLAKDLMLRVSYIHLADNMGVMLFNMHHIASDGWSTGVLIDEFVKNYTAIYQGGELPSKPLSIQYADYAYWQRKWLTGKVLEKQLNYWDKQLDVLPQLHSLPLDFERPKIQKFNGTSHQFQLNQETSKQLKALAHQQQVTLFMVIHAVFSILIARYSNNNDVVIGTPVANRMQPELESLIGFFVNTLVLRVDCADNPVFTDFLKQVKLTNVNAQANQDVPFEFLVDRLNPARSPSYQTLFQIMLNMNTNEVVDFNLPNVQTEPEISEQTESAKFDLVLTANVNNGDTSGQGIDFTFQYNTDLFATNSVVRFAESLITLLTHVVSNPTERIGNLALISETETNMLLYQLNASSSQYPKHLSVHQLFEQQAEKTPNNPAASFENQSINYHDLNNRANQLAHFMLTQGIKPGFKVGLCFDRCIDLIIAQLAVFKSGAAFVPLATSQPKARLQYMVKDSELSLILTHSRYTKLTSNLSTQLFTVDDAGFITDLALQPQSNPLINNLKPEGLAYIIYTSGSTGLPKGVLNTHLGLNNLSHWHVKNFDVNAEKVGSHLASISFDAAVWEIWPYLIAGAKIQIIADNVRSAPLKLIKHLNLYGVTHSFLPTALLEATYDYFDTAANTTLEYIFVGGEKLNKQGFIQSKTRLINNYGPTESSVVTTSHEVKPKTNGKPPALGKPVDNIRIYILNSQRSLVPFKTTGELYIAGDGLAQGYQNMTKLSSEKFISHTFPDGLTENLYQSGDLVRYIEGNLLEFVAREDNQVKVRGFRIEPGEIEFHLSEMPQVASCVVLVEKDQYDHNQIAAYIILHEQYKTSSAIDERIKSDLKSHLPEYMIPSYLTLLDEFPVTTNGKIDNSVLTSMAKKVSAAIYLPPSTELEKSLVKVLSTELQLPLQDISMGANFFHIGGNSLSLLNVINQMNQLGYAVKLKHFYECSDLQEICQKSQLIAPCILTDTLIQLNANKGAVPLFLFHSMIGRADCYKQLALMLEPLIPVIGVQAPFVSNHDLRFDQLNELTHLYAQAILAFQPVGPYRIGGWSIGALLAQQVVKVLNEAGKEVEYFVGIDCFMDIPTLQKTTDLDALHEAVVFVSGYTDKAVSHLLSKVVDQEFSHQLSFAAKTILQEGSLGVSEDYLIRALTFMVDVFKANFTISKQIITKQATLLIAKQNNHKELLMKGWHNALDATTLQKEIDGEHSSVLEGKSLEQIAAQLSLDMTSLNNK